MQEPKLINCFSHFKLLAEALKNAEISMIFFGTKGSTEPIDLWAPNDSWDSGSKDEEKNTEEMPEDKGGKGSKHASVDKGTKGGKGKKEPDKPHKGVNKGKKDEEKDEAAKEEAEPKEKPDRFKPDSVDEHKAKDLN